MAHPAIELESFRVFRNRVRLEIRPLTLIFGRNQAGKSTILRSLPLIADAVFGNVPVFDNTSPSLMGSSFKELGWLGPQPSSSPIIRLEGGARRSFAEVQLVDDRGVLPNRIRVGQGNKDSMAVSLAGSPSRSAATFVAEYAGQLGANTSWRGPIQFSSMLPSGIKGASGTRIGEVVAAFKVLERVQWLAAPRPGQVDVARHVRCCRSDGADLASLLAGRTDVVDLASDWLASSALGEAVLIGQDPSGSYRIELRRMGNEALPNHLSGEGAQWLLPILLCACWAELDKTSGPSLLAIEEPEARLHPNLQIGLFERLQQAVKNGVPCVLETHSIHLLRRAQLAVVEREIAPEELAVFWVERDGSAATIKQIEVRPDGTLSGWNPETFEEEQLLTRQIFEARWKLRQS